MISINEARRQGIRYIRMPHWAMASDHIELPILPDGALGPWFKLWSAINAAIGQENPVSVLCINMGDFDAQIWEPCDVEKARVAVPARAEEPEPMPPPHRRRQAKGGQR